MAQSTLSTRSVLAAIELWMWATELFARRRERDGETDEMRRRRSQWLLCWHWCSVLSALFCVQKANGRSIEVPWLAASTATLLAVNCFCQTFLPRSRFPP
jgi:hypothetical protein